MNIAIFGGTFNPIHNGHIFLATSLIEKNKVDEVWLMVSPLNPLKKSSKTEIESFYHRVLMTQIAVSSIADHNIRNRIIVSDFEKNLPVPSYTIDTLDALSRKFPEHKFSILIGADNWENFERWYKTQEILTHYHVFIHGRPNVNISIPEAYKQNVELLETELHPISSSIIRAALKNINSQKDNNPQQNNEEILSWVPQGVIKYIQENKCYGY